MLKFYIEAFMILIIVGVLVFLFSYGIQTIQTSSNEQLSSSNWLTAGNWDAFNLANTFVNNIWIFFVAFAVLGVAIAGYVTAQKRGAGY